MREADPRGVTPRNGTNGLRRLGAAWPALLPRAAFGLALFCSISNRSCYLQRSRIIRFCRAQAARS